MNSIAQEARKRQAVMKLAIRKVKSFASSMYGVSLSSVKRWCKRYDGDWRSLREGSHHPKSNPKRHTVEEERRSYGRRSAQTFYAMDGTAFTAPQAKPDTREASAAWCTQPNGWDWARRGRNEKRRAPIETATRSCLCRERRYRLT